MEQAFQCAFKATNNEAEYEALIIGMRLIIELGARNVEVRCDSQLVSKQIQGEYQVKDSRMQQYHNLANSIANQFKEFKLTQIPRDNNKHADALANLGSTIPSQRTRAIPIIRLQDSIINSSPFYFVQANYQTTDWRFPIYHYLNTGHLPDDQNEARRIKQRASKYRIFRDELYKWSYAGIYQKCLGPEESEYALRETHEGECGNHSGPRSLTRNLLRAGYFWPKMYQDAQKNRLEMYQVLKIRAITPTTSRIPSLTHPSLPIHAMGDGHRWQLTTSSRKESFPIDGDRLLHKMDRSWSLSIVSRT